RPVISGSNEGALELRGRIREVRRIENVEELRAELQVGAFRNDELLRQNQVLLEEGWPFQKVAFKVAELARLRNREGRRVEDLTILENEGVNTRDQVGTVNVARGPPPRLVDARYAPCARPAVVEASGLV